MSVATAFEKHPDSYQGALCAKELHVRCLFVVLIRDNVWECLSDARAGAHIHVQRFSDHAYQTDRQTDRHTHTHTSSSSLIMLIRERKRGRKREGASERERGRER